MGVANGVGRSGSALKTFDEGTAALLKTVKLQLLGKCSTILDEIYTVMHISSQNL